MLLPVPFHFLFLPSTQLPHVCFAFHTLTYHDKMAKHDDITDDLTIQMVASGLIKPDSRSLYEHVMMGPPLSSSKTSSSTILDRFLSRTVSPEANASSSYLSLNLT